MQRRVLLVNRSERSISKQERALIEERFSTSNVEYISTKPEDIEEHLLNCARIDPDIVLYPVDPKNVLLDAVRAGYLHVAVHPGTNKLARIASPYPQFDELY